MTANALAGDREKCLEAGMNDHVAKPIEPDNLFKTLVQWIPPRDPDAQQDDFEPSTEKIAEEKLPASLEGIDVAEGLRRVGGNRKLYRKLLVEFFQDHRDDVRAIRKALDQEDLETAQRLAHTIKGVSGSIGAGDLFSAAEKLDAALKERQQETYVDLLSGLEKALAPIMQELKALSASYGKEEDAAQPAEAGPLDVKAVGSLLDEMKILVEEMNPEAEEKAASLKAQLGSGPHRELVQILTRQINDFEFEEASQTLSKLKTTL